MIVREKSNSLALLFMWRGTILPKVLPMTVMLMCVSMIAWGLSYYQVYTVKSVPVIGFTVLGVVLSVFLSFRNSACYDRWWEGRKLWGALVANTRHLTRDSHFLSKDDRQAILVDMLIFVNLLKDRLRHQQLSADNFAQYLNLCEKQKDDLNTLISTHINAPQVMLERMQIRLMNAVKTGQISDMIYVSIQRHVVEMGSIQAGCDRIHSTPVPLPYSVLLHRAVFCFCWLLPFGVGGVLGLWTPLLVGLVAYLFLGLDELSKELEEPFGVAQNDLPLDAMTRLMERETLALLGCQLPPVIAPRHYYLS
ncbi:MAG: bestrophin family protein [Moraxella sp.]|nr:bestrophin family protein [Moraxella sp.]